MDADNNKNTLKVGDVNQNSFLKENHPVGVESAVVEVNGICGGNMSAAGPNAILETTGESNGKRMAEPSTQDVEGVAGVNVETNVSHASENLETKEGMEPKGKKTQGKGKSEKPSNIKNTTRTSVKKINNTTEIKGTSNGTLAANTRPKQPVTKNKSFNDRHATNFELSKGTKLTPATSNARKDKLPKSEITSSSGNSVHSEGNSEKSIVMPLPKGSATETDGDNESVGSGKSHRLGKLPAYDFSFRCLERAEKRKEFYTKLEQRIHAQEMEKHNQQAKSKESQEAEIKMLRKSLTFKATPMPSFSQLPKVELKKIPITRPKSPKLGRKKNSSSSSVEGDGDQTPRQARLSLDEKFVSHNKPSQGLGSTQSKQPLRKSVPRLPSEKTQLAKTAPIARIEKETPFPNSESAPIARLNDDIVQLSDSGSVPIARVEEEDPHSDPNKAHHGTENGSLVVDDTRARQGDGVVTLPN